MLLGEAVVVNRELERRFILDQVRAKDVLSRISNHIRAEIHDQERPRAYTKTTYFETRDLEYLRSYYRPVTRRLRVRQYANASGRDDLPVFATPCYLELKETYGLQREKIRFSMTPMLLPRLLDGTYDLAALAPEPCARHPQLGRVVAQLRRQLLRPILTTWYRRHSFHGNSGRVRITLDQDLVYSQDKPYGLIGQSAAPARLLGKGHDWILEVKCRGTTPGWLDDALSDLPEARSYSKYRSGMESFHRARVAA
jgi:hypothetical protein